MMFLRSPAILVYLLSEYHFSCVCFERIHFPIVNGFTLHTIYVHIVIDSMLYNMVISPSRSPFCCIRRIFIHMTININTFCICGLLCSLQFESFICCRSRNVVAKSDKCNLKIDSRFLVDYLME